jgi:hypothetical protein
MKTNKNQLQQGDVLLKKVNIQIPAKATRVKDKRGIVLAEGEATGHYHGIDVDEDEAELIRIGEKMLLNVKVDSVTLNHQEHNPVTIGKGTWEVGQVVEKDWLSGMVKKVVD